MSNSKYDDISSAKYICKSILEDAELILYKLSSLEEEDQKLLPTWWTNKLSICYAYINSLNDYIHYSEEEELVVENNIDND